MHRPSLPITHSTPRNPQNLPRPTNRQGTVQALDTMERILSYQYSLDLVILSHQLILLIVLLYKLFSTGLWPRWGLPPSLLPWLRVITAPSYRNAGTSRRSGIPTALASPAQGTPLVPSGTPLFRGSALLLRTAPTSVLFRVYSTRRPWWISLCSFLDHPSKISTHILPTIKITIPVAPAAPGASHVYGKGPIKALKSIP